MVTFLMVVQLLVATGLIVAVVLQESKGEGLGSIGGGSKMFFSKASATEKIMEAATKYLAIAFILLSVVLSSLRY
ncbi:MAG: preprotein translocase subunit SecG [Firmicutes bacterium]|nr:preprotein translocase subunit SecG [Bacillota bacterium]